jgi:hypothetical protein
MIHYTNKMVEILEIYMRLCLVAELGAGRVKTVLDRSKRHFHATSHSTTPTTQTIFTITAGNICPP